MLPEIKEPSRRLTEEELELIKDQLLESIYADIGKNVVKKFLWIVGSAIGVLYLTLSNKEKVIEILKALS